MIAYILDSNTLFYELLNTLLTRWVVGSNQRPYLNAHCEISLRFDIPQTMKLLPSTLRMHTQLFILF